MEKGITIIVCCYNSAVRLPETMKHIALQKNLESYRWELIIVDNNSTDATISVAKDEWMKYQLPVSFSIVCERQQGLSYARRKGVETAKYGILIFCDDDNWLQEDYVSIAYRLMLENNNIGIAGGKSTAVTEMEKPLWFDNFENVYAVGKQLSTTGYANGRKYVTGAGMVIRKEIFKCLDKIGFCSLLTDRKENSVSSGGDGELCILALYLGYDLYYDENLQFTHYISAERTKWHYCVKMITRGFAIPQIYFYMYDYCYQQIIQGKIPSFEYAYKRNYKKPIREIKQHFFGIKNFLQSCRLLLVSLPGSKKETELKARINRLIFVLKNKGKLKEDFEIIYNLLQRLKNETAIIN